MKKKQNSGPTNILLSDTTDLVTDAEERDWLLVSQPERLIDCVIERGWLSPSPPLFEYLLELLWNSWCKAQIYLVFISRKQKLKEGYQTMS